MTPCWSLLHGLHVLDLPETPEGSEQALSKPQKSHVIFSFWALSNLLRGYLQEENLLLHLSSSRESVRVVVYWACLKAVKKRTGAFSLSWGGSTSVYLQCETRSITAWDVGCKHCLLKISSNVLCVYQSLLKLFCVLFINWDIWSSFKQIENGWFNKLVVFSQNHSPCVSFFVWERLPIVRK